jgi:hypothetical protein
VRRTTRTAHLHASAKRVLGRGDRFDEVLLDFKGVSSIGPAFADEIIRVFASDRHDSPRPGVVTGASRARLYWNSVLMRGHD